MAAVPSIGRANLVEPRPVAPEAAATHALYERHASRIHSYCLHQLGSREEAEDAVQTTFMNAFRALRKGITPEAESAWLFKIAENVCLSRRRSSWRRGRIESPSDFQVIEEIVPGPSRQRDELIGIEDALAGMPEQQRRAILLREWQGLSYREIAEELEVTQAAVETLIFRARRSLAAGLEQPATVAGKRKGLRRAAHAFDLGSLVGVAKALLAGGAAVKATAAAVAVTAVAGAAITAHPERQNHASNARPAAVATGAPAALPLSRASAPWSGSATPVAPNGAERPGIAVTSGDMKAKPNGQRGRAGARNGAGSAFGSVLLLGGRAAQLEAVEGATATAPPATAPVTAVPPATAPATAVAPVSQQPATDDRSKSEPVKVHPPVSDGDAKAKDERPKSAVPVGAIPAQAAPLSKEQAKDAREVARQDKQDAKEAKEAKLEARQEARQDARQAKQEARETAKEPTQDARELANAPQSVVPAVVPNIAAPTVVGPPAAAVPAAPAPASAPAPAPIVAAAPSSAPVPDSTRARNNRDRDRGEKNDRKNRG